MNYEKIIVCFLSKLTEGLDERKKNTFIVQKPLKVEPPEEFAITQEKYDKVYEENKIYGNKLELKKSNVKVKLRQNEVNKKLKDVNTQGKLAEFNKIKQKVEDNKLLLNEKKKELEIKQEELNKLREQTVDVGKAAKNINKCLRGLGNQSFSLTEVDDEFQNGQYQIKNSSGSIRDVNTLSTGEKNIVAFLWFMFDLKDSKKKNHKEMVVIFDDPMNSNDDNTQYLIIGFLQQFYR